MGLHIILKWSDHGVYLQASVEDCDFIDPTRSKYQHKLNVVSIKH